jgi:hypothetical protein
MGHDKLTTTVIEAVESLSESHKAKLLLKISLDLIESGQYVAAALSFVRFFMWVRRYNTDVEKYLEVYLRTPDIPKEDVVKALLARGNARTRAADDLLAKAKQGQSARRRSHTGSLICIFRPPNCLVHRSFKPPFATRQTGSLISWQSQHWNNSAIAADTLRFRTSVVPHTTRSVGEDRSTHPPVPSSHMALRVCFPQGHRCSFDIPRSGPLFRRRAQSKQDLGFPRPSQG